MIKCCSLFVVLFCFSCSGERIENVSDIEGKEEPTVVLIDLIEKPSNVLTEELWPDFETDIEMAILFYKGDSLVNFERKIVDGLKEEFSTLEFHEFYSDDNLAQVFLNDTLVFDLSNYMSDKSCGFVLLKPGFSPKYEFLDDSLSSLKINFREFYGNK